ncbi:MAG: TRAP transporter small permease [Pseudomonadota bacterium]
MTKVSTLLQRVLEWITIGLLVSLAGVVISAVIARKGFNASFVWYDEVASVLLAWITFYGAAYAALRRRHLGFEGLLYALPLRIRLVVFAVAELVVYGVFAVLGYAGWFVLQVFGSETLVSLDWVPLSVTQAVVPIGAGLFILAQILSTPEALRRLIAGETAEAQEIAEEIEKAEAAQTGRGQA